MPKTNLADIFKNGDNFKFEQVDYSKPENNNRVIKIKEEQEAIRKRTDVDWKKLEGVVVKK